MKKLLILIYFLLLCITPFLEVFASNSFARITANYAYLYKHATKEVDNNVLCYLEKSYFVEITLDYNADFYKVNYNGVSGYVLKSSVSKVIGTPNNPYPTTTLTTINNKCYLRSTPTTTDDNIVTVVPENCTELTYIGKIYGEEAIDYQGSSWYLVTYFGVQGYIYSKYIDTISAIAINTETIEPYATNLMKNPTPLDNYECGILIAILSVPVVLIIILMYKPTKEKVANVKKSRKLPKKKKSSDLDELL